ncbi:MAG: A/G-specific adenine glycosylase [Cyclobacteriaceae bacterium]|nr:A/G-specific adenine glycosylase [Cyclobacteriaceae bacterium]
MTDFDITRDKLIGELAAWFNIHKRELPWRHTPDPYKIWLSEIILQQTRVDQGLPYYHAFVENFPTVHDLAKAPIDRVLRLWQGLGYYSRGRNLHACAKIIVEKYSGCFPAERQTLLELPGIGDYTAAAIASFAFGKKEAVVDGNVIRVISRLFGITDDTRQSSTISRIKALASQLLPDKDHPEFNQAMMEFGAMQCRPGKPDCLACPLADVCVAYKQNRMAVIPFKSKSKAARIRHFNYLVIEYDKRLLLMKRSQNDIWKYLYEFLLIETLESQNFDQLELPGYLSNNSDRWVLKEESGTYLHVLSHQKIMARFYHIHLFQLPKMAESPWKNDDFLSLEKVERLPKPVLIARYLDDKIISSD